MVNHLKQAVFYSASDEICLKTKMNEIFVYRPRLFNCCTLLLCMRVYKKFVYRPTEIQ